MDKLILSMKVVLGTTFTFYIKTHACHWNIEGIDFHQLHQFFGEIYNDVWSSIDYIAEQIRQLDAYTPCSLERLIDLSLIKCSNEVLPANDMIIMLLKDNDTVIDCITEALHLAETENKQGLVNFLAGRLEAHNKWRWQLRATAKKAYK